MSIYRGRYYSASGCDSSARPGTRALMSWYLGAYAGRNAANLGTYVCKRLGSGWSIHAERRAADLGTAPYGGVDSSWGWALANALRLNSAELGVQLIILGRKVWSCTRPDAGWRSYGGEYHGHAHVELIPSAADDLTAAKIQATIHGKEDNDMLGLSKGDRGQEVKTLQIMIWKAGRDPGPRDGIYGEATSAGLLAVRKSVGSGATSGDHVGPYALAQLHEAVARRYAGQAANEAKRQMKAALEAALADLPAAGELPARVVLDLPDELVVPVEPAGDEDDEGGA